MHPPGPLLCLTDTQLHSCHSVSTGDGFQSAQSLACTSPLYTMAPCVRISDTMCIYNDTMCTYKSCTPFIVLSVIFRSPITPNTDQGSTSSFTREKQWQEKSRHIQQEHNILFQIFPMYFKIFRSQLDLRWRMPAACACGISIGFICGVIT